MLLFLFLVFHAITRAMQCNEGFEVSFRIFPFLFYFLVEFGWILVCGKQYTSAKLYSINLTMTALVISSI